MADRTAYLRIRDITMVFGGFRAVDAVSLDVAEHEFVCFLGPSGCGKTTLLRIIAGLEQQTSGTIEQAGRDISKLPPSMRDFGIVFQSYALFPNLTVTRNVGYGLENAGRSKAETAERVRELLTLVGLTDQAGKYPAQLSGGQQQRVALSRAIAISPSLLLLDEPLSALDAKVRTHLRHEVKALHQRLGITTIMVTHDQEEALTMADRIVVMNHGRIEQVGTPTEIYREPTSLFVADFIGETNQLPARVTGSSVITGRLTLDYRGNGISDGTAAVLTIRPEDIIPVERAGEAANRNRIDVRIGDMEFFGSSWRARLDSERLEPAQLIANFSNNAVRRLDLRQGGLLTIELPPERIKVFPAANRA